MRNQGHGGIRLRRALFGGYHALAFAYLVYSEETGSGLAGWLVDLQFRWFGAAETGITLLVGFAMLCIPVWAIGFHFYQPGPAVARPTITDTQWSPVKMSVILVAAFLAVGALGALYLGQLRNEEAEQ